MRYLSINHILTGACIFCLTLQAQATTFGIFDARTAGMGGSCTATGYMASAPFCNAAMVGNNVGDENFELILPMIGATGVDQDNLLDDIDAFQNAIDSGNPGDADAIFNTMNGKTVNVIGNVGASLGFKVGNIPGAVSYQQYGQFSGRPIGTNSTNAELEVRGMIVSELSASFAWSFVDNLYLGVTPKYQQVSTYEYAELLATIDTGDFDILDTQNEKDQGGNINLDLGLTYKLTENWILGLTGKNLLSQSYTTVRNATIETDPQVRAGIGYNGGIFTVGLDYDLTENNAVGFEDKTQLLAVGVELNALDWIALRAGYTENMASGTNTDGIITAGLGFTPFGVGLDLAGMVSDNSVGAYLQFGFGF